MPAAEGLGAFTFVLSYVVKTCSPIQTGAGGTGVWLPCKKTYILSLATITIIILFILDLKRWLRYFKKTELNGNTKKKNNRKKDINKINTKDKNGINDPTLKDTFRRHVFFFFF